MSFTFSRFGSKLHGCETSKNNAEIRKVQNFMGVNSFKMTYFLSYLLKNLSGNETFFGLGI
jgi:hypothetical protein